MFNVLVWSDKIIQSFSTVTTANDQALWSPLNSILFKFILHSTLFFFQLIHFWNKNEFISYSHIYKNFTYLQKCLQAFQIDYFRYCYDRNETKRTKITTNTRNISKSLEPIRDRSSWDCYDLFLEIFKRPKTVEIGFKRKDGGKVHSNECLDKFYMPYISVAKWLLTLHL